jgi:hypothetical protein
MHPLRKLREAGKATPAQVAELLAKYDVDISGGSSTPHYVGDYQAFSGLMFPTRRRVFPRLPDGQAMA